MLTKKALPEGRFIEIEYDEKNRVKTLKEPHPLSGKAETTYTFDYHEKFTDVMNANKLKTRYRFDKRSQLIALEAYDKKGKLYRVYQKFWGKEETNRGLLIAKTLSDGNGSVYSYCSYQYDRRGNVSEKQLYGNLSGKGEALLSIDAEGLLIEKKGQYPECQRTTQSYSTDGYNLLIRSGTPREIESVYSYKPNTNLCVKELFYEKNEIKKRIFHSYNEDGVRVQTIEDNGVNPERDFMVTEKQITIFNPKSDSPGVGLPEMIEHKILKSPSTESLLVKRFLNTYDSQGNVLSCSIYDSAGQHAFNEQKSYNNLAQPILETDRSGNQKIYTYDGCGNKTSLTIPHENKVIQYFYDLRNQLVQTKEAVDDLKLITENHFDLLGLKIATKDHFGNMTTYEYDEFGRLSRTIFPQVSNQEGKIIQPVFCYSYDIFGNILSVTDPLGYVTKKSYNLGGNVTKVEYPDGSTENFNYDLAGKANRSVSRTHNITFHEYDSQNRVTIEQELVPGEYLFKREFTYDAFHLKSHTVDDLITHYTYDAMGRVSRLSQHEKVEKGLVDPSKTRVTEITHDSLGRISQKKVWFDVGEKDYSTEHFVYDLAGNIVERRIEDALGFILLRNESVYDVSGRCLEEYGFENNQKFLQLKTTYNGMGESVAYLDGLGNETTIDINYAHRNALNQKVIKKTIINALKCQTEIEFDALGRVFSVLKSDLDGKLISREQILYDAVGNKCSEIHDRIIDGKVVESKEMRSVYGPMGRLEEQIEAYGTNHERKTSYKYNLNGQIISKTIPGYSAPFTYVYNKEGKLTELKCTNENQPQDCQILHSYRYKGDKIISAKTHHDPADWTTCERKYTPFGQISEEKIVYPSGDYALKYDYDRKGRIKSILLPDASSIVYRYDALFGREVYRLSPKGKKLYSHQYDAYDENGRIQEEHCIGEVGGLRHRYDLNGKETSLQTPYFSENCKYDALGRLTKVDRKENGHPYQNLQARFTYNDLSQLTSERNKIENDDSVTKKYSYDSIDNRLKNNNEKLIYNALEELVSHNKTSYAYNLQGNLSSKIIGNDKNKQETSFKSNPLSEIVHIEKFDKTQVNFGYDAFGRCLSKTIIPAKGSKALSVQRFIYLGEQEIGSFMEKGKDRKLQELRIPGLNGETLSSKSICLEIKGKIYAPLHDGRGNVIALVDPLSKSLVESYTYSAFGETTIYNSQGKLIEKSIIGNPWRYAEKRYDEETGFIHFCCRFYDPKIGRWISPDPLGTSDGPNLYAYTHNNPLNCNDKLGLSTENNSEEHKSNYGYPEISIMGGREYIVWAWDFAGFHYYIGNGETVGGIDKPTQLPHITYDENFERSRNHNPYFHSYGTGLCQKNAFSYNFDLKTLDKPDIGIGFINGILNDYNDAYASAAYISRLAGGINVHAVYNATHGALGDLSECKLGLNNVATEPVRQLHNMWNSYFEKNSSVARFLMICHSQGAIHVRNALLDYPQKLRDRILVVAIAPGGYIYKESCAEVIHYRAEAHRDFIPRIDHRGAERSKDTIIELPSHFDASYFDHSFMSPTYQRTLYQKISNYIKSHGENL